MSKPSIYRRLVILAAATLTGLVMAAGAAQAQRPTVPGQIQHYLECLDWLINNPAKHAKECGPGHPYFIENPKSSGSPPPDCPTYVPSAYLAVGTYHDCYHEDPCDKLVGYVQSTFGGDCPEPCVEGTAYLLTGGGYGDCEESPPCGVYGSLKLLEPEASILAVGEYEWPDDGCDERTIAPLNYDDTRLLAI